MNTAPEVITSEAGV